MTNVIIVHGSNENEKEAKEFPTENERHWKPWLKKELEKKGINVSNQLYPEDWLPDYTKWKKVFEKNKIDKKTILIGHSAGTAFLLRWLSENKKKINKLILIAPSILKGGKYLGKSKLKDFEFDSSLKKYFDELIVFYADNDGDYVVESAQQIHQKLGGKSINLSGKGHFVEEHMKTKEFPELLAEILK